MRVYILQRHIDHEGSENIGVYADETVAKQWLDWCQSNTHKAERSIGEPEGFYITVWSKIFPSYPGGYYAIEEMDIVETLPGNRIPRMLIEHKERQKEALDREIKEIKKGAKP